MKASTNKVKITPSGVAYLDGYLNDTRQHPAQGVHDGPLAVLVLLDFDGTRVLFLSLDVCVISLTRMQHLRDLLSAELGVDDKLIVMSTIHSHSCPNGLRDNSSISHDTPGYVELVTGLVVQAASTLEEGLVDVTAQVLDTHIRGWYSNRNSADKPFDDSAHIIRFVDPQDRTVAALQNFNCHSTVVGPTNMLMTSDLQGAVRAELTDWIGVTPYAFTGASGDLGNRQFRRGDDFAELRRVSNGIAAEFMKAGFSPLGLEAPAVREFVYQVDYDNTVYYSHYRQLLEEAQAVLDSDESSFTAKKLARTEVKRLGQKLEVERYDFPIVMRVIDMGGMAFVTFPGELGSMLGMRIKAMFNKPCLVIGYANDYQGYFLPAEDFGLGYESFVTKMQQGGIEKVLDAFEEWL